MLTRHLVRMIVLPAQAPAGYDSVKAVGRSCPDPLGDVMLNLDGIVSWAALSHAHTSTYTHTHTHTHKHTHTYTQARAHTHKHTQAHIHTHTHTHTHTFWAES